MDRMKGDLVVLDPRDTSTQQGLGLAPRPVSLDGKVIGLLSNNKFKSDILLRMIGDLVKERYSIRQTVEARKSDNRYTAPPEMIDDLASRCDAVIIAVGDCGSCVSCSTVDSLELEKNGVPSVVVVTKPFISQGKAMAKIKGVPDYGFALIDHPVGSLAEEELQARAAVALPQVLQRVLA
jgi:hypothetical protein